MQLLSWILCVLLWGVVLYRVPILKRRHTDKRANALWSTLVFVALATTLLNRDVYSALDGLVNAPNISKVLAHSCAVAAGWQAQVYLSYLRSEDADRRASRVSVHATFVVTVGLLWSLFLLWGYTRKVTDPSTPSTFAVSFDNSPLLLIYWTAFLSYFAVTMFRVARGAAGYSQRIPAHTDVSTKLGMMVASIGCVSGLLYTGIKLVYLFINYTTSGPNLDPNKASFTFQAVALLCMSLGSVIPSLGRKMGAQELYRWWTDYSDRFVLRPFWLQLTNAVPTIRLRPHLSLLSDVLDVKQADLKLYRLIVEIYDGLDKIADYFDAEVERKAASWAASNLREEDRGVFVESAVIGKAIVAYQRKELPREVSRLRISGDLTALDREVEHLKGIAKYLRTKQVRGLYQHNAQGHQIDFAKR